MMKKTVLAVAAALAASGVWAASAAFSYQGVLLNGDDTAMTGNKTIEFRLYGNASGGDVLWGRAYPVLLDPSGLFSVELSDASGSQISGTPGSTLAQVFASNAKNTLYLGMTVVGSSGEIAPRQKLLAVPYATFACDVSETSGDFSVAGRLTAASAEIAGSLKAGSIEATGSLVVGGDLALSGAVSGFGSVPVGGIIMWSGSREEIPDGWALCNGQSSNGVQTPDLCNRFVVGAGADYDVGATGGADAVALTERQMPAHNHVFNVKTVGYSGSWNDSAEAVTHDGSVKNNGRRQISGGASGGGQPHENRPPYYALCFIMRVK